MKKFVFAAILLGMTYVDAETITLYNASSYSNTSGTGTGETGQVASAVLTASGADAGVLFRGSVTPGFSATAGGSLYWSTLGTANNEAGSVSEGDFMEFRLQADSGYQMDLSAISVEFGGSDSGSAGSFNATVYVQLDAGAGFETVGSKTITIAQGAANTNVAQDLLTVDLSGFPYRRLSDVSFRVGAYDSVNSSTRYVRAQDISLSGTVSDVSSNQYCFIGAYPNGDNAGGPTDDDLDDYRETTGRGINIFMFYGNFGNGTTNQVGISSAAFSKAETQHLVPFYKLSPKLIEVVEDGDDNNIDEAATATVYRDIKDGVYDDFLHYLAQKIDAYDCPTVIVDFAHEMNGGWKEYHVTDFGTANSPDNFIAAWRHLVDIFDSEGLGWKVMWSFAPDASYNPSSTSDYHHVTNYYPGNGYVDFVGCSTYAKGTTTNKTLPEIINPVWVDLMEVCDDQKPFVLSECAAVEEAGGSRLDWLRDNFTPEIFRQYKISLFNWFNQDGDTTSQALDDAASIQVFQEMMDDDFFMGEYCTLRSFSENEFLTYEPVSNDVITVSTESPTNEWRMFIAHGFDGGNANCVYLMNSQNEKFLRGITSSSWVDTIDFENWTSLWWDFRTETNGLQYLYNNGGGRYLHDRSGDLMVDVVSTGLCDEVLWHIDPLSDLVAVTDGFDDYLNTTELKTYWYAPSGYEPAAFGLYPWARYEGTNSMYITYDFQNYPHRHTVRTDFNDDQDWSGRKYFEVYYKNTSHDDDDCYLTVSLQTVDWQPVSTLTVPIEGLTGWQQLLLPLENEPNVDRVRRIAVSLQEDVSGGSGQVLIDSIGLIDRTY